MEKKNILTLVVTLTVGIILCGSLLVPVIDDAQSDNSTTFTNNGSGSFTINGTEDYTLYNTDGKNWVINGVEVNVGSYKGPLVTTDMFRFVKSDSNGNYMQLFDENGEGVAAGGSANTYLFKIVYTASTNTAVYTKYTDMTETEVAATYTYSCTHVIEYNPNGTFTGIDISGGDSYYVNNANDIVSGGAYTTGDLDTAYFARGTSVSLGETTYTGSAVATLTSVSNYLDVSQGSNYTVTVTDGDTSESFTPYTIYVPKTIVGHTPSMDGINALYGAIPIMVILGLVVTSIGAIATRNRD